MSVTLENVWNVQPSELIPILKSQNIQVSDNDNCNRIIVSYIYYNYNMLSCVDRDLVRHPDFNTIMMSEGPYQSKIALLSQDNSRLIQHFQMLYDIYTLDKDVHRSSTFRHMKDIIAAWPTQILSSSEFKGIKGIGPSSLDEIDEFLQTGTSSRLQELKRKHSNIDILNELRTVYGIGPEKAKDFYAAGVKSIDDLHKFTLTHDQQLGLQYHEDLKLPIPRSEIDGYIAKISTILGPPSETISDRDIWTIAGSYRRGELSSGDIDIAICNVTGNFTTYNVVNALRDIIIGQLALGDKKFMGISRLSQQHHARRLDIRIFNAQSWPYALLYNTGSQKLNILMRFRANEFGYTLNEYGLISNTTQMPAPSVTSEAQIFELLRIAYIPPALRYRNINQLIYI